MSWFVQPETVRIDLPEGQWIEVKKTLSAGERRKAFASAVKSMTGDRDAEMDPERIGVAALEAYLVDWSLTGPDGKAMRIDTPQRKRTALDLLHPSKFALIDDAVSRHIAAMEDSEKNDQSSGESTPEATSLSAA